MGLPLSRWLLWLAVAACCALPGAARPAPIPMQTALLVDETGTLDDTSAQALLQRLQDIQASGRAQVAILVAAQTHGEALADYSLQVAQAWKLGRAGRDDGLLVVVLPRGLAARIEVGYGLESAIPDLRASQWVDELLPAIKDKQLAQGLDRLLDRIEAALPVVQATPQEEHILDQHPEWKLPFVLAVFAPFALFPLIMGRWGALMAAPLFAVAMGWAAWLLWHSQAAMLAVGGIAFLLPLLWSLNREDALPPALALARGIGNSAAVAIFFFWLLLFLGVGLWTVPEAAWGAPLFAGTMALGLAGTLFGGTLRRRIMIVLRSLMHFILALAFTYPALQIFDPQPTRSAFAIAGAFTGLVALSLYLDSRESSRKAAGQAVTRWSLWILGLALLLVLPVGVLMLAQAVLGGDLQTQLVHAAAGGGSIGTVLWWAARKGLFAALQIGLGGRFGGGGAEGRG